MLGGRSVVAKSLKVTGGTYGVVAAISAAVALNATVAMASTGTVGQVALGVIVFVSVAVAAMGVCSDIFNRSSQTVANLRSIGATTRSLSSGLTLPVLVYGLAGSVLGAAGGVGLGTALGSGATAAQLLTDLVGVAAASSAAIVVGAYVGARSPWRS